MTPMRTSPAAGRRTLLFKIPLALAISLTLTAAGPAPSPGSAVPAMVSAAQTSGERPVIGGDAASRHQLTAETSFASYLGPAGREKVPAASAPAGEPTPPRPAGFPDAPGPGFPGEAIEPESSHRPHPDTGSEPPARSETGGYVDPTTGRPSAASVLRPFDRPAQNWLPGHRGVDLPLPVGAEVLAAGDGTVAFAGVVAGTPVVSIDHPDGIRTTYQPVFAHLAEGDQVMAGAVIGRLAHPADEWPGLHWGARVGEEYLNPLGLLSAPVIRLKPVDSRDLGRSPRSG